MNPTYTSAGYIVRGRAAKPIAWGQGEGGLRCGDRRNCVPADGQRGGAAAMRRAAQPQARGAAGSGRGAHDVAGLEPRHGEVGDAVAVELPLEAEGGEGVGGAGALAGGVPRRDAGGGCAAGRVDGRGEERRGPQRGRKGGKHRTAVEKGERGVRLQPWDDAPFAHHVLSTREGGWGDIGERGGRGGDGGGLGDGGGRGGSGDIAHPASRSCEAINRVSSFNPFTAPEHRRAERRGR